MPHFYRNFCIARYLQLLGLVLTLGCQSLIAEEGELTKIAEVRKLAPERAAEGLPVKVEGQVMHVIENGGGFFLFDGSHGIFVQLQVPRKGAPRVQVGDLVQIKGITMEGNFYPAIGLKELTHLGTAPLPEPRLFYLHELYFPVIDAEWVSVRGRLVSMAVVDGHDMIVLGVEMNDVELAAHLPYTEANYKRLIDLMFRLVSFDAVAGTIYNNNRQLTGRIFFTNSADSFELLDKTQDPSEGAPFYETHELARVGTRFRQIVETSGVITHAEGSRLYVRGPVSSLLAVTREPKNIGVGDVVSLKGFTWPQPVSPAFQAVQVEVTHTDTVPKSVDVRLDEVIDPGLNYELISLEARLVDIGKSFNLDPLSFGGQERVSLLCRSRTHLFEAYLPAEVSVSDLEPGALLRLTGIALLNPDPRARWRLHIEGFSLQIRSPSDIEVIQAAPFWTMLRFLSVLAAFVILLVLFLVWVILLRRTVDKQTSVIGEQVERQTILDERQRVARELHDNLEQGLAGMAIQLRGVLKLQKRFAEQAVESIRKALELMNGPSEDMKIHLEERAAVVEKNAEQGLRGLTTVQDMLVHCSEESRASILDLRGGLLERMDLPTALEISLEPLADAAEARLLVETSGAVRRLRNEVERQILLIIREAVSNALRHGHAQTVCVDLLYDRETLCATVTDDGSGFDLLKSNRPGHFGLVGMHERANQLNAEVKINSEPGDGTTVQLVIQNISKLEKLKK